MKIGIISDVHRNPEHVALGIAKLKERGVERLIFNGDIGEAGDLHESQEFTARILEVVGQSGLESYVQPGSHETLSVYGTVVSLLSQKYGNIMDMTREPFVDLAGYRVLFLPGSDVHSGGEYHLRSDIPSGQYAVMQRGLCPLDTYETLNRLISEGTMEGRIQVKNMQDMKSHVQDPLKSLVVCHVPAHFPVGSQGVDYAYFATKEEGGFIPGVVLENQIREAIRKQYGQEVTIGDVERIAENNGFTFRRENVGNTDLRALFDELGIRYAVSGHIHESGHHAHERKGLPVFERTALPELFWNSGCFDQGQMGVLTLEEEGIGYHNVRFSTN